MSFVIYHVSCDMCHMSRVTCHVSRFTCHVSHVTFHLSPVPCQIKQKAEPPTRPIIKCHASWCLVSHVMYHMSCVMCHALCVTCHVSRVICQLSPVTCHLTTTLCSFSFYESPRWLGDAAAGCLVRKCTYFNHKVFRGVTNEEVI